jgi:hypothetical protein
MIAHISILSLAVITDFVIFGLMEVFALENSNHSLAVLDTIFFCMQLVIEAVVMVVLLSISDAATPEKKRDDRSFSSLDSQLETPGQIDVHYYNDVGIKVVPVVKKPNKDHFSSISESL